MSRTLLLFCLCGALAGFGCGDDPEEEQQTEELSLSADVMPVFAQNCAGCHARENSPFPDAVANGVYFENKDDILANVGTFIVAGDSANSGLVGVLRQDFGVGASMTLMPPPDVGSAVPSADVARVAGWIDDGANDN